MNKNEKVSIKDEIKEDKKLTKTQKLLIAGIMSLLRENSFNKITVNDICNRAMVSRTTFYSNFKDKYDLLKFAMEEVNKHLVKKAEEKGIEHLLMLLLDHIHSNQSIYKNLMFTEVNFELARMFSEDMYENCEKYLRRRMEEGHTYDVPIHILAVFMSGGISQFIVWWISSKFETKKEDMVKYIISVMNV